MHQQVIAAAPLLNRSAARVPVLAAETTTGGRDLSLTEADMLTFEITCPAAVPGDGRRS